MDKKISERLSLRNAPAIVVSGLNSGEAFAASMEPPVETPALIAPPNTALWMKKRRQRHVAAPF